VKEYKEDAIIYNNNKYITINKNGRILCEKDKITNKNIPIINKVEIVKIELGSNIELKDESKQKGLLYLLECIDKNNLKRDIKSIELNKKSIEMINSDGIKILMNIDEDIDYNIKRLSQVLIDLKTKSIKSGIVDLRSKEQVVYSPM
ncbi:MAG: cell division protein FtsQ/DivIB, partial [Paraclostridium sp.]